MNDPEFIEIPVTANYDQDRVIGELRIDKRQLPKRAKYLFAVEGIVKDWKLEWNDKLGRNIQVIADFELTGVTLLPESRYDWRDIAFDDHSAMPEPTPDLPKPEPPIKEPNEILMNNGGG